MPSGHKAGLNSAKLAHCLEGRKGGLWELQKGPTIYTTIDRKTLPDPREQSIDRAVFY